MAEDCAVLQNAWTPGERSGRDLACSGPRWRTRRRTTSDRTRAASARVRAGVVQRRHLFGPKSCSGGTCFHGPSVLRRARPRPEPGTYNENLTGTPQLCKVLFVIFALDLQLLRSYRRSHSSMGALQRITSTREPAYVCTVPRQSFGFNDQHGMSVLF